MGIPDKSKVLEQTKSVFGETVAITKVSINIGWEMFPSTLSECKFYLIYGYLTIRQSKQI